MSRHARMNPDLYPTDPAVLHAHIDCDALAADHERQYLQEVAEYLGRDLQQAEKDLALGMQDDTSTAESVAEYLESR